MHDHRTFYTFAKATGGHECAKFLSEKCIKTHILHFYVVFQFKTAEMPYFTSGGILFSPEYFRLSGSLPS
jgi:hypothetical protein